MFGLNKQMGSPSLVLLWCYDFHAILSCYLDVYAANCRNFMFGFMLCLIIR